MSLKKKYRQIKDALGVLKLTSKGYGYRMSLLGAVIRNFGICRQHCYKPREAFQIGIFNPDFNPPDLDNYFSRKSLTKLQEALNPPAMAARFKNKALFYEHCRTHNLPIPELYGLFSVNGKRLHAYNNGSFVPVAGKEAFLESLPSPFALKLINGASGKGFRIITRIDDGFRDHEGISYTPPQLLKRMAKTKGDGILLQQVVSNHSDIKSLSPAGGLQTMRVVTLTGLDKRVKILTAYLRMISSKRLVTDNFVAGNTGNIVGLIDQNSGSLQHAVHFHKSASGFCNIEAHPVTQKPFKGFVIPHWPEVCELAHLAAQTALPARTIGWDITVTPDGPMIIEGNIWWDPPNHTTQLKRITEELKNEITKLEMKV